MKPLIDKNSFLILLSLVVISMAWRPFFLGFYSDDYNLIIEVVNKGYTRYELFESLLYKFANRPLYGVNAFLLIPILGDSAIAWHSFSVVFSFLIAFVLLKICRIFNKSKLDSKLVIYSSLWILLPINFGFLSWPTCIMGLPVVLWYLLSFYYLIRNNKIVIKDVVLSLFFYMLCIFTYESFYFQFIPMLGACFIYKQNFYKDKIYIKVGLLFFLLQALAIIFNRTVTTGGKKSFDADFIINRILAAINNPEYLIQASIPILFIIGSSIYVFFLYKKNKVNNNISNDQLMIINFIIGIIISICIYLSVGYSIRPFGLGSRTAICFSIFISFILFFIARIIFNKDEMLKIKHLVIPILLSFSVFWQGFNWASSKNIQEEVLNEIPIDKISNIYNSLILCLVPNFAGDVLIFEDIWSLNPAILNKYKIIENNRLNFLPHKNEGFRSSHSVLSKNTHQFITIRSGHESSILHAENIYIWNYYTKKLYHVDKEITIDAQSDLTKLDLGLEAI